MAGPLILNWEIRSAWNSSWIRFQRALSIAPPHPGACQFVWRSLVAATPCSPPVAMTVASDTWRISAVSTHVEPAEEAAFDICRLTGFDLCQLSSAASNASRSSEVELVPVFESSFKRDQHCVAATRLCAFLRAPPRPAPAASRVRRSA